MQPNDATVTQAQPAMCEATYQEENSWGGDI